MKTTQLMRYNYYSTVRGREKGNTIKTKWEEKTKYPRNYRRLICMHAPVASGQARRCRKTRPTTDNHTIYNRCSSSSVRAFARSGRSSSTRCNFQFEYNSLGLVRLANITISIKTDMVEGDQQVAKLQNYRTKCSLRK